MPQIEKKDISFKSANKRSTVAGYIYTCPDVTPFCVVQISHGMCEFFERYAEFASFLAQNRVAVCGNDHIGHGKTAATEEDFGFFDEKGGRRFAIQDLHTMNTIAHETFPGLPVILLGHSMGSFFARKYAAQYPDTISGLIISGTGGPNPLAGIGIFLAALVARLKGPGYRSSLVHNVAFGSYLKRIANPKTQYDWISCDDEIVRIYAADAKCTFRFTANGFHELFSALKDVSSIKWAQQLKKSTPVYLFSGDADPVGNYGKGVVTVYNWLKKAGIEKVTLKIYPGGRHEMLNELNRTQVYKDVLQFLQIFQ